MNKESNRQSTHGRETRAKCPNCNKFVNDFMTIFMNFEDDDNESASESSSSSEVVIEGSDDEANAREYVESIVRNERPTVALTSSSLSQQQQQEEGGGPEIIDVDADDMDWTNNNNAPFCCVVTTTNPLMESSSNNNPSAAATRTKTRRKKSPSHQKMQQTVKKLKKRLRAVQALAKESLQAQHESTNMAEELKDVTKSMEDTKLELETIIIQCSKLKRQVHEMKNDRYVDKATITNLKQTVQSLESQLYQVKAEAQDRIMDARKDSRKELLELGDRIKSLQQKLKENQTYSKQLQEDNDFLRRNKFPSKLLNEPKKHQTSREKQKLYQEVKEESEWKEARDKVKRRKLEKQRVNNEMMSTMSLKTRILTQAAKLRIQERKTTMATASTQSKKQNEKGDNRSTFTSTLSPTITTPARRRQGGKKERPSTFLVVKNPSLEG